MQGQHLIKPDDEVRLKGLVLDMERELDPQGWTGPGHLDVAKCREIQEKYARRAYIMGVLSGHREYNPEEVKK